MNAWISIFRWYRNIESRTGWESAKLPQRLSNLKFQVGLNHKTLHWINLKTGPKSIVAIHFLNAVSPCCFFFNLNDMSLVCEDLTQAHGIYMPNYYYMVLQKYTTYNGLREHFPEKSDHEGMDHTPWAVNRWQCWTVESTYSVDFLKPNIMRIRTRVVFSNQMSPQITWTKSNLKLRDDGGRTEAAWCCSPLIPTCRILFREIQITICYVEC